MRVLIIIGAVIIAGILGLAAMIVLRPLPETALPGRGAPSPAYTGSVTDWQADRATRSIKANHTLTERLLFTPGRRPREVEQAAAEDTLARSAAPKIYLRGTVLSGDRQLAILIDPAQTEPVLAQTGDHLSGGWQVEMVEHGRVVIAHGDRRIDLLLKEENTSGPMEAPARQRPKSTAAKAQTDHDPRKAAREKALRDAMRSGRFDPE